LYLDIRLFLRRSEIIFDAPSLYIRAINNLMRVFLSAWRIIDGMIDRPAAVYRKTCTDERSAGWASLLVV
jgi:hypothetical protein